MAAPASMGQLAVDDYGNPFIIIEEKAKEQRLTGLAAHRASILAAQSICEPLHSSLGPYGMDKMIVGPDGDVIVTNDGATILANMDVSHPIAKLLVDLSKAQDDEIGDGTTAVVILAGALLTRAMELIDKGIHPLRISAGFERACEVAVARVEEIAREVDIEANAYLALRRAARTALVSKVVSGVQDQLAKISAEAILSVADLPRRDVDFDLIKVEGKPGGRLEDTSLMNGILVDKEFSHPQMQKVITDARIAILTCPFEPPKPKTKHRLDISTAEAYKRLAEIEQCYFRDQIKSIKNSGANLIICQWGFDDEANHLLYQAGLSAVRWVGGVELELIAIATGGRIVPRFAELTKDKLGRAKKVEEKVIGTMDERVIIIEEASRSKAVTILVRGGNQMIVDEAKRCLHDAICCVRNLIRDPRIVPGGGASETAVSLSVQKVADKEESVDQYSMRAFASALEEIPIALAHNSGLVAIAVMSNLQAKHEATNCPCHGVDCLQLGTTDMWQQNVYESYAAKCSQLRLATQVVKLILKIDDVITSEDVID
eukprot:TRINITY_DN6345_c0_g1_i1.p1 TRINITY_DN6345_c0_g1~~TRINITY_DN6345_c0_g1_i1.p1  ORF type:complete len:545 (-),score=117.99 TRINITY_DN6345_c0_g1_i1:165-1799(-)